MTDLTRPEITFFVIVVVAVALLITERLRNDVVGVLIVVALAVTDLLSRTRRWPVSRASPPGLSDVMRGLIGRLAGKSLTRVLAVIMPSVGLRSAFTHHVTTTAVMLPVT